MNAVLKWFALYAILMVGYYAQNRLTVGDTLYFNTLFLKDFSEVARNTGLIFLGGGFYSGISFLGPNPIQILLRKTILVLPISPTHRKDALSVLQNFRTRITTSLPKSFITSARVNSSQRICC